MWKAAVNAVSFDFTIPESVHTAYKDDLQMDRLSVHLRMLPDIIKRHGEVTGIPIKKVTNIHTICYCMNETPMPKIYVLKYIFIANISYHSSHNINFWKNIFSYEETKELFKVIHDTGKAK